MLLWKRTVIKILCYLYYLCYLSDRGVKQHLYKDERNSGVVGLSD